MVQLALPSSYTRSSTKVPVSRWGHHDCLPPLRSSGATSRICYSDPSGCPCPERYFQHVPICQLELHDGSGCRGRASNVRGPNFSAVGSMARSCLAGCAVDGSPSDVVLPAGVIGRRSRRDTSSEHAAYRPRSLRVQDDCMEPASSRSLSLRRRLLTISGIDHRRWQH